MRVKGGPATRNRRKKILKLAKGYYGSKHRLFRTAKEQVVHSLYYAFRDRKAKKREFRKLWIVRINAAANMCGVNYSTLMHGLKVANIDINRKMLSELAINDFAAFAQLVETAKNKARAKEVIAIERAIDLLNYKLTDYKDAYVTSGASTPSVLVDQVVRFLESDGLDLSILDEKLLLI